MSPWAFESLDARNGQESGTKCPGNGTCGIAHGTTFGSHNCPEPTAREKFEPFSTLQSTVNTDGRRFSDVTNTSSFPSRRKNPESFYLAQFCNEDKSENQEIAYLKNLVVQKEAILESTRQELQKALYYSYKSSQQNKQLTQTNGQMFAELCLLREKFKLLEHEYKQMTTVFRLKREELEGKVRDLSQKLENKHQSLTKDRGQSDNPFQSELQHLSSIQNQNCYRENLDQDSNRGENSPRTNLSKKEGKTDGKRTSTKGCLTSKRASHLATKCKQGGQTVSMPTMDQIDRLNASFNEQASMKEVLADDVCNEGDTLSRANGSTNEEDSMGKRTCLRRQLTSVSYNGSPLHKKIRKEQHSVSIRTLDQINQCGASLDRIEIQREFCEDYTHQEADCLSRTNMSLKEEASNEKREADSFSRASMSVNEDAPNEKREADCFSRASMAVNEDAPNEKRASLRRRSTQVSYKEPKLTTKLRRSSPTVSPQKLFQSDNHITTNVLENLEKARKGDITNEVESSSRIYLFANEENKHNKRVGSKQSPSNSINGDSNLNANTKLQEHNLQTLDKVGKDEALHFDAPQSESVQLDLSETFEDPRTEGITSKTTRVQLQPVKEIDPCHASALNTALEAKELRSSTKRPVLNAVECVTSSKEIPLDDVVEAKKQQCNVPRKIRYLSKISESSQNCAFPTTQGITNKVTRVQQHQLQENAPSNPSTFNPTLDAAELRRSSTGRPVRKAVETVSSYKEIPRNIKLRRSQ